MNKKKLGFCLTGSFCTFTTALEQMRLLVESYDIVPVLSYHAATLDTRFGTASDWIHRIEAICHHDVICTIAGAEPFGPKNMTDLTLVAPCTGNTLAKLSNSITDTPVTMAVKSTLRNAKPVVIAVSTNDGLSGGAKNIALLQNQRHYYFVPYRQDNHLAKPTSLVADFDLLPQTITAALAGVQLQPMMLG